MKDAYILEVIEKVQSSNKLSPILGGEIEISRSIIAGGWSMGFNVKAKKGDFFLKVPTAFLDDEKRKEWIVKTKKEEVLFQILLKKGLSINLPNLRLIEDKGFCFALSQKINGVHLQEEMYQKLSQGEQEAIADALAHFLLRLHKLPKAGLDMENRFKNVELKSNVEKYLGKTKKMS